MAGRLPTGARAAALVGVLAGFVTLTDLVRLVRWRLLADPDPSWAAARFLLWIAIAVLAGTAGAAAGGSFALFARSRAGRSQPKPLPLSRAMVVVIAALAVAAGAALRIASVLNVPIPYLEDEVTLVTPSLELSGTWRDFRDPIRPIPYGVPNPHETIGVLYLRLLRWSFELFGTTPAGLRFPSLAAGCLSLVTGALLARALLPAGGGALAALVLAGMRWHVILSLSGFHSIFLVPLCDLSALLLVLARRRGAAAPAAGAGLVIGIGAHAYLASWVAAAALLAFAALPAPALEVTEPISSRARRAAAFAAGFLAVASPLFLVAQGRITPFGRASRHSVFAEMRYTRSPAPLPAAAADALIAPFGLPEPEGRHDLTDRSRLGPVVGLAFAAGLAGALLRPREEASSLILCHGAAALAAAVTAGQAGLPNGFRFGYLTTLTAVAASSGALWFAGLWPPRVSRAAAWSVVGFLAVAGVLGAREAVLLWPDRAATFASFHGEDTLIGMSAARWDLYGSVAVESRLGRNDLAIDTVRRYRLDAGPDPHPVARRSREFRIARPGSGPAAGERVVERVRDGWGRDRALVFGRAGP